MIFVAHRRRPSSVYVPALSEKTMSRIPPRRRPAARSCNFVFFMNCPHQGFELGTFCMEQKTSAYLLLNEIECKTNTVLLKHMPKGGEFFGRYCENEKKVS